MDKGSLIGIIIGLFCFYMVASHASHHNLMMFFSMEGVYTVIGGSISVCFMAMPLDRLKAVPGYIRRFLFNKGASAVKTIEMLTAFAEKARRDGILALESDIAKLNDQFLITGLKMAIDGSSPEIIESRMRLEVLAMQERHKAGKKFFDLIKLYGPGWGLVGTLIGQVAMFGQLGTGSIEDLGNALKLAVVATMYGTVAANAIAGPIGDKLALRSSEEVQAREMMLQGVLSILSGDNPRVTQDKLLAFIPTPARAKLKTAA